MASRETDARPGTLADLVALLERRGDAPFLGCAGEWLSARAVAKGALDHAAGLRARGVARGDRVAIYLEKRPEKVFAILGCGLLGAISVVVNQRLKDAQVAHVLADSGARIVVTSEAKRTLLAAAGAVFGGRCVVVVGTEDVRGSCGLAFAAEEILPELPATILYTSGSTGAPKGIVQSHRSLCDGARIVAGYLGLSAADHVLALLPLSFDYGLNQVLSAAYSGARVTLLNYLATQDVLDALEAGSCTALAGVPTLWVAFCAALRTGQADPARLASLRYVTNSGGRLGLAEIRTLRERLPWVEVFSMYGLTEAFRSAYLPPGQIDRIPGSIGKAIPEVELLVVDPATRRECAPGEIGELVHTGALIADGYWRREADTARVFGRDPRDAARGRAVFSGDFVRRDAEGWLWFVGRRDEQLKVMGYRVAPEEVETELRAVDGVLDACVLGVPDDALGDRLVAGITARPGAAGDLARRARRALEARLPAWLVPSAIEVVAELPQNQNGKPDRRELARRLGHGGGDAVP